LAAIKKIPDAEFCIMNAVWQLEPPVTSGMLLDMLNKDAKKVWKLQTIHTLLGRLINRGFLKTEKKGKERLFTPLMERDEYLQFETENFMKQYHGDSLIHLVNTMYHGEKISDEDITELVEWANKQREGEK